MQFPQYPDSTPLQCLQLIDVLSVFLLQELMVWVQLNYVVLDEILARPLGQLFSYAAR